MIRKWRKKCEIEQKIISFFIVGDCYTEAICAPRTPRTMAKENRTESWGWGKVKVKLYNIIVAKRFDSTSLRLSAKIARFLYVSPPLRLGPAPRRGPPQVPAPHAPGPGGLRRPNPPATHSRSAELKALERECVRFFVIRT